MVELLRKDPDQDLLEATDRAAPARAFLRRHAGTIDRRLRIALELEGRSALARGKAYPALFARAIDALARELLALPPEGPEGFDTLESWVPRRASIFAGDWVSQPLDRLAAALIAAERDEDRDLLHTELRARLMGPIDGVIRDTLRSRQLGYEPDAGHFNAIFDFVIDRIFAPDSLGRRLASFDPAKGNFEAWFLYGSGSVVRNEARMWLRERSDEARGIKKEEEARAGATRSERALGLNDEDAGAEGALARAGAAEARERAAGEADASRSRGALAGLKPEHRVVLRALMIAYEEPEAADLEVIAQARGVPEDQVRKEAEALRAELSASEAFEEDLATDLKLGALLEHGQLLERRRHVHERKLEAAGMSDGLRATLRETARGLQLGEIAQFRRAERPCPEEWASHHERHGGLLWDWVEGLIRADTIQGRLERLRGEARGGRRFVRPSHQQLAEFLGVAPGTVASRLNRAKADLDRLLESGRKPRDPS